MERKSIPLEHLSIKPYTLWEKHWLLLTAGDFETLTFNNMTISWGSIGVMWDKPFVQVVVRPGRYTAEFINKYLGFTVCAFPERYHQTLQQLGSTSGRDMDKILHSGFTPIKSSKISAPGYEEADLIVECEKLYWQDMESANFLNEKIPGYYPKSDYHRIFYGEILAVSGTPEFFQ